ncbi:MAG TPA: hypothetical protein VFQ92_08440 [Blastocatellia bacterium]|nr:hypothetical protein [Blastocatellia bacterium]
MKRLLKIATVIVLTYCVLLVGFYTAMCQRPEVFSRVMTYTPGITFLVLPFKPMWLHARKGNLKPGDYAPDFTLETYDKKSAVQLSSFRGHKPVVLVFGSYT